MIYGRCRYHQASLHSMAVLDVISRVHNHFNRVQTSSCQLYGVQTDLYLSSKDNGISFKIVNSVCNFLFGVQSKQP